MKIDSYFGEIWVDIKCYEGLYQVSNYGRVKSLGNDKSKKEKLLKTSDNGRGHLIVRLYKNGIKKPYLVHRLVAEAFLPNAYNKSDVHHKDHNKLNNNVDNLVWLTKPEHAAEHPERYEVCGKAARKACSKHINQFTLDGLLLRVWYSSMDIKRELGYNNSHIIQCCRGNKKYSHTHGYIWKYADEE